MRTPPSTATGLNVCSMAHSQRIHPHLASPLERLAAASRHRRAPQRRDIRPLLGGPEVERAAPEGRKAGAEDDAGIDHVGALDDAFVATALAFEDQRIDQLPAQALQLAGIVRLLGLDLLGLAILPDVEALRSEGRRVGKGWKSRR